MLKNVTSQPEFAERIETWKNMDRTTREAQSEAFTFYDEQVFPIVKEAFISKNCPRIDEYDGLILPVGFSPEPLILSILAIKAKEIAFLYTPDTQEVLNRIQKETKLPISRIALRRIGGSDIVEVYKAIMSLYDDWGHPANIAVDITGGKKSMVSGVAMAGAVLGADIYYVDNHKFHRELSKPEPGSEYLSLLDNPYTVFGDLEVDKAKDLYNGHDYAGAKRVFDQLKHQVGDTDKTATYEAYGLLCAGYEAWDNLNFGKAKNDLHNLLTHLDRFSHPLFEWRLKLIQQKEALELLLKFIKNEELALASPDGFHFAFMLYHNALRREAQGKLDTACLILYRLLGWIEQHRLARYKINTSEPNYSACGMSEDTLLNQYTQKRKGVYKAELVSTLPNPIALVDGFLVLDVLEDDIVKDLNWNKLKGQVKVRNHGIYAHGMSKINPKSFEAFKSTVEEYFEKAQNLANIKATAFNEQHEFIAPLP